MMWLVIAALLLAAAIQGIGYYQQAAYVYQAKSDTHGSVQWAASRVSLTTKAPTSTEMQNALGAGELSLTRNGAVQNIGKIASINDKFCVGVQAPNVAGDNVFYATSDDPANVIRASDMPSSCGSVFTVSPGGGSGGTTSGGTGTGGTTVWITTSGFMPNGDYNHNGVPNSADPPPSGTLPEDLSGPGMGDGTSAGTIGTVSGDNSGNFNDSNWTYDASDVHTVMQNLLPPGQAELNKWIYDPNNPSSITVRFWGDGSGYGVGGSAIILGHVDIQCYNPTTNTLSQTHVPYSVLLKTTYTSNPGPNTADASVSCDSGTQIVAAVWRSATEYEWEHYSVGSLDYVYSRDIIEGWVKP